MYSFINDLPEDGLKGPKHVGGASQNVKVLFMVTCTLSWIKFCIVKLLVGMWIKLNLMNLGKLRKFMDRLSDLKFQELFVLIKLLRREILCMRRCRLYSVGLTQYLMKGFCENGNELCTMNLAFNLLYLCPFHSTSMTDESGGDFQQVEVCRGGRGCACQQAIFIRQMEALLF
jgi:hypothetical protein